MAAMLQSLARTYKRDALGRFAGGGGSGGKDSRGPAKVGRAGPRGGKTGTKAEQRRAAKEQAARSAQFRGKAGSNAARDAYKAAARGARLSQRGGTGSRTSRPTGARNAVKPFKRPPVRNNVRPLKSVTADGAFDRIDRKADRSLREMSDVVKSMGEGKARRSDLRKRFKKMRLDNVRSTARMQAQALADRLKGGVDAEIASITLGSIGGRLGRQQIQRRARRAALKASRGSKPAAKAVAIYDKQLAYMGPGKPSRKGKSNIVPGPRNPNQPPKKPKRKRKK